MLRQKNAVTASLQRLCPTGQTLANLPPTSSSSSSSLGSISVGGAAPSQRGHQIILAKSALSPPAPGSNKSTDIFPETSSLLFRLPESSKD